MATFPGYVHGQQPSTPFCSPSLPWVYQQNLQAQLATPPAGQLPSAGQPPPARQSLSAGQQANVYNVPPPFNMPPPSTSQLLPPRPTTDGELRQAKKAPY